MGGTDVDLDDDAGTTGTLTTDGTLAPGGSPGVTIVDGDVTLAGSGTFQVELFSSGGTPGTDHDQLEVIGAGRCFEDLHQLYQRTRQVLWSHQERPIYEFSW